MGMYTELHFNSELKGNTPTNVISILKYMVEDGDKPLKLPDHPLFKTCRWETMLVCDSYYFDAETHSTLRLDNITNSWYLCIRSNFKNYDNEVECFLNWIYPYLNKFEGDFLGFYRYEEFQTPSLIFYQKDNKC